MSKTQNQRILADLRNGAKITSLDAWVNYGCSALNSRISDIRNKMSIPVEDVWISVVGKDGQRKTVKQYFIKKTA